MLGLGSHPTCRRATLVTRDQTKSQGCRVRSAVGSLDRPGFEGSWTGQHVVLFHFALGGGNMRND